jgi:hypothetical protein
MDGDELFDPTLLGTAEKVKALRLLFRFIMRLGGIFLVDIEVMFVV